MEKNSEICPICKNKGVSYSFTAKDYISAEDFSVCGCAFCGSAVIGPRSAEKEISEYYSERYYGRRKSYVEKFINYGRELGVVRSANNKNNPSLLDIGCGNGTFLMSMRRRGWAAVGTEIAPPEHILNGAGEFIFKGSVKDQGFADKSFDVVTMWHSLEHLSDLQEYLGEIRRILRPGGSLIIEVPNFKSFQSRIFKGNWFHLDAPRHLFHFSPKGMRLMLERSGFSEIQVFQGSLIYEFFGYIQSFLNVFTSRKNLLFDFLNHKLSIREALFGYPVDFLISAIGIIPAGLISLLMFVAAWLSGGYGIMGISARL